MKTKEELNALKDEVEALNKKLAELSEEELAQVSGGWIYRDIEISLESENGEGEKKGTTSLFSPAYRDFLDRLHS